MTLQGALSDAVERAGISHREAAEEIGVSQQVFSRWVAGDNVPKADQIPAIARFLGMSQKSVRDLRIAARRRRNGQLENELGALRREVAELRKLVTQLLDR